MSACPISPSPLTASLPGLPGQLVLPAAHVAGTDPRRAAGRAHHRGPAAPASGHPEIPAGIRGQSFVVVEAIHLGEPAEADRLLTPLRALVPVNDTIASIPMPALSHLHMDPDHPVAGTGDGLLLTDLPARAVDAVVATAGPGRCGPSRHGSGCAGSRRLSIRAI